MNTKASIDKRTRSRRLKTTFLIAGVSSVMLLSCSPTVKVEAPDEPIEINLNIKIEQDVRVRLDKDVEDLIADNPDIF